MSSLAANASVVHADADTAGAAESSSAFERHRTTPPYGAQDPVLAPAPPVSYNRFGARRDASSLSLLSCHLGVTSSSFVLTARTCRRGCDARRQRVRDPAKGPSRSEGAALGVAETCASAGRAMRRMTSGIWEAASTGSRSLGSGERGCGVDIESGWGWAVAERRALALN